MSWSYLKMSENLQNSAMSPWHQNKLGYKYLSHSLFIRSSIDRPLSCLSLLAVVNNAALNTGVHILSPILISSLFFFISSLICICPRNNTVFIWGSLSMELKPYSARNGYYFQVRWRHLGEGDVNKIAGLYSDTAPLGSYWFVWGHW